MSSVTVTPLDGKSFGCRIDGLRLDALDDRDFALLSDAFVRFQVVVVAGCDPSPDGEVELLTKGDNNRVDDWGLYAPGQVWLKRDDVLGRAIGTLRYVGMVTIILNDYPMLKYVLVGVMGLFVLTNKEG